MRRVSYNQTGHSSDSTSRLERLASLSRELTAWPDWKFYPVVQQLVWPFSSPCMLHTCAILATSQSRGSSWVHTSWAFFTLSHTLPLHNSHLNTRYLIAKLQENLAWNKANTWLNKFNITISPFGYSVKKPLKQTLDLTCELETIAKTHSHPNSRNCEALEPYKQVFLKTITQDDHCKQKSWNAYGASTMRSSSKD